MTRQPKERIPCESCGFGIVGAHMKRHSGSKACQRLQKSQRYTRALFQNANPVEKRRAWNIGAIFEALAWLFVRFFRGKPRKTEVSR